MAKLIEVAALAALGAVLILGVSSPLKADSLTENRAVVTFDRPVEVPGKVLAPGAYVFKILDNDQLVQVFSAGEKQLLATIVVYPQDRPVQDVGNDCFIQLNNGRAEGLFFPGRATGFHFVYPAPRSIS